MVQGGRRLLARLPLRQLGEGLVPGHDGSLAVDHEDRVAQAFQGRLEQPRSAGERGLAALKLAGAAHDDIDTDNKADEGAGHDQKAGNVGLLLLRPQRRQPSRQQEPLAFDEGVAQQPDLPEHRAAGARSIERERRVAAVDLVGAYGGVELVELLCREVSELLELTGRVGITRNRGLELTHARFDTQTRPLIGLEAGDVAGQQEAAHADLGVLHRDHHLAHQRHCLVVRHDEALLARRGLRMGKGQHEARRDQHGEVMPAMTPVERADRRRLGILGLVRCRRREDHGDPAPAIGLLFDGDLARQAAWPDREIKVRAKPPFPSGIGTAASRATPLSSMISSTSSPRSLVSMRISGVGVRLKSWVSAMLTASVTIRPIGMAVSGPTAMIGARI